MRLHRLGDLVIQVASITAFGPQFLGHLDATIKEIDVFLLSETHATVNGVGRVAQKVSPKGFDGAWTPAESTGRGLGST